MKRITPILLSFCLLLAGCRADPVPVATEPPTMELPATEAAELTVEVLPTVDQFTANDLLPEQERIQWLAPTLVDGQTQLRCLVKNETEESLTVDSLQVICYRDGETITDESYNASLAAKYLRPADARLTLVPGDSTLFTITDPLGTDLFDEAEVRVTLLDESEVSTEQLFRFTTDPDKVTPSALTYEGGWDPVELGDESWVFFSVLRNETDAPLYLDSLHITCYLDGVPVLTNSFFANQLDSRQTADIGELSPGEVVTYSDAHPTSKSDFNQRELTFLYRYAQGKPYLLTFRFRMDPESASPAQSGDGIQVVSSIADIPAALGKAQYSADQIRQMLLDRLTLEEVAERISTVADLAQYLHEARYGMSGGDLSFEDGGVEWHLNASPHSAFYENRGNAGGCSNLVNYLLRGDYQEQGYFVEVTYRGAHVHNYILQDGIYYFLDLPESMLNQLYDIACFRLVAADSLQSYSNFRLDRNHSYTLPTDNHHNVIQYCYPFDGSHRPLGLKDTFSILPEELRDSVTILYTDERFEAEFAPTPAYALWPALAK